MRECEAVHDVEWEIRLLKRVNKALKVIFLPALGLYFSRDAA